MPIVPHTNPPPLPAAAAPYPPVWVAAWIALALGLHGTLLAWFGNRPPVIWDEHDYVTLAANLVRHGEFAFYHGTPASLRPPLYPAFLAFLWTTCGVDQFLVVRLVQVGLSLGSAVLVQRLAAMVAEPRTAWLAGGCMLLYPSFLGFNQLLLTEVLFTFLLLAATACLSRGFDHGTWRPWACAGILWGLAALARSVIWLFPAIVLALAAGLDLRQRPRRLPGALLFVLAFGLTIAPWCLRNSRLERTVATIDTMSGRNFMMGNYEHTPLYRGWAAIEIQDERAWWRVLAQRHPEFAQLTQGQRDKLALRHGLAFAATHPELTALRIGVRFFNFWQLERELVAGLAKGLFGPMSKPLLLLVTALIFGSYASAMLLGIYGAWCVPPRTPIVSLLWILLIAYVCGMHSLVFAHSRYHLPLIPFVLIFASQAVVHRRAILAARHTWRFRAATACALVLLAGWMFEVLFVDLHTFLQALHQA